MRIIKMEEISQRQKYDLKRTIEDLKECKGKHTELISLYIPSTKQISDVSSYLKNELSESQNIKSKSTRKNVLSAIESILSRLRNYKKPPENGVVFFVGHKNIGSDQTSMIAFVVEPPMPFKTFLYRCDSLFYLEPLEEMLIEKEVFGLLLIDRRECTVGILRGNRVDLLKYMTSQVPGKHGRGGQSQRRFERLTEIAAHEWFVKCGEKASEIFSNEENIKGILIGGPGPTKKYFIDEKYLHYLIQDKIIDVFDTGYTDEFGLRELVSKASETMIDLEVAKEKSAMKLFLKEITKNEKSLAIYGEEEIRTALDMGAVDVLLLSDGIRKYRLTLKCSNCNFLKYITIEKDLIEDYTPPKCFECDSSATMEIIEKKDIIDELSGKTEKIGGKIILISRNSEEGDSLYSAFNGMAGILRYPIEI
jgi:peptide chain release factor subunit 1